AAAGASLAAAIGLSAIVFSGAAQILAVQLLAAGAPLAVIVLTCFVAGLRFLIYSAAMAPYLRPLPPRWQKTLAFLLTDQAFAAAIRRFDAGGDARAAGAHFLGSGFALWAFWQVTNVVGFFAGNLIPAAWSLDFAVPLCFIALVAPHFRTSPTIVAALVAGFGVLALGAADEAQPDRRRRRRHRRRHARRLREGAMDGALKLWVVIAIVGVLNYLSRLSFI